MIHINENFLKLESSYLFVNIGRKVKEFQEKNANADLIKLGIGDVTLPLTDACLKAFHQAVDEMGQAESFKGYGPEQGYAFLREAISDSDFKARGVDISADEIFISDGAKCDTGNIQELFASEVKVAVQDPVYPVYVDTNVMAGRTGKAEGGRYDGLVYLDAKQENGFIPALPKEKTDLIYLCFPNNPTGACASRAELKRWVDYARENKALILYDAAYEAFIRDPEIPHSIFEIEGAREVAIEFRSFSKTAGFTGTRCAFTVIPKACRAFKADGEEVKLHALWNRRHSTKFNGVSYPVQKAAAAVYTAEGKKQVKNLIDYYLENAAIIRKVFEDAGFKVSGGENSPYIWINFGRDSWEAFDEILEKAAVVITPGAGFGSCGNTFIRVSAFNTREKVEEAMRRIQSILK